MAAKIIYPLQPSEDKRRMLLKILSKIEENLPEIKEVIKEGEDIEELYEGHFRIKNAEKKFELLPSIEHVHFFCRKEGSGSKFEISFFE
jgi:Fe2+ or Zn2+ uptake regulation protein